MTADAGFLIVNPRSGNDSPSADELRAAAAERGVDVHLLGEDDDLARSRELPTRTSSAWPAATGRSPPWPAWRSSAASRFVCVPFGTRNHFARDAGLDRDDPARGARRIRRPATNGASTSAASATASSSTTSRSGSTRRLVHRREQHRRRRDALARRARARADAVATTAARSRSRSTVEPVAGAGRSWSRTTRTRSTLALARRARDARRGPAAPLRPARPAPRQLGRARAARELEIDAPAAPRSSGRSTVSRSARDAAPVHGSSRGAQAAPAVAAE